MAEIRLISASLDWFIAIAIGILAGVMLVIFVVQKDNVYGDSMVPTLKSGYVVMTEKISTYIDSYHRGDIVILNGSECLVTGEGDLEFIDVLGHVLLHTHVSGGQTRISLPRVAPGVYLMRLTNGQECQVQKIVMKK